MTSQERAKAKLSVIAVGNGGRGFIVGGSIWRFVITAAHCLPRLPTCHLARGYDEYTYGDLLGPLGEKPTVPAACVFVDPMSDIAVLGSPDEVDLSEAAERYKALTNAAAAHSNAVPASWRIKRQRRERAIARILGKKARASRIIGKGRGIATVAITDKEWRAMEPATEGAWLLSLDGRWVQCGVQYVRPMLSITRGAERVQSGMSGSPVAADDGSAMGIVSTGGGSKASTCMCPAIFDTLPGWLVGAEQMSVLRGSRRRK